MPAFDCPINAVYYAYEDYPLKVPLESDNEQMMIPDEQRLAAIDEVKVEQY